MAWQDKSYIVISADDFLRYKVNHLVLTILTLLLILLILAVVTLNGVARHECKCAAMMMTSMAASGAIVGIEELETVFAVGGLRHWFSTLPTALSEATSRIEASISLSLKGRTPETSTLPLVALLRLAGAKTCRCGVMHGPLGA